MCHHVTMVAKFLDYNNRELKQRQWRQQQERQKSSGFIKQNNNYVYANASHFFVHFSAIVARLQPETS